ncbi:hypothetical protein CCACVL1_28483 [Corchorus capsularis]|uniref:Uncharacterized protein n=1 Tax=Corchorus capsularis TaxID=210143 RepID=A0A1R3G6G3_COCAP|nr:hypothetical protein CCACVL1_28483 [Corchorus capsularis]
MEGELTRSYSRDRERGWQYSQLSIAALSEVLAASLHFLYAL